MTGSNPADNFLAVVSDGIRSAQQLLSFLEQENTALKNNDLDTFLELAQQKKSTINILEHIDRRRAAVLQAAGMDDNEKSMADFLLQHQETHVDLTGQWQNFLDILKSCQRLNETNGRMIHARQQQLQQALEILHGQLNGGELAYDQQGRTTKDTPSRPIAKA